MGGSSWSDASYSSKTADKVARGVATFDYDADIKSGRKPMAVHDTLNIKGKIRESRDSAAHPESNAIAVFFDVTGSMHTVPQVMQKKLPQLMGLLLRKSYIEHPQVLFGAVGDANSDRVPLQVGQFESGIEMDDNLTAVVLEGGGGGSYEESYQLALYAAAHRMSCDCFEKRSRKGYLFIIGDEMPYKAASRHELTDIMGVTVQEAEGIEKIVEAAKEKWNVFFIIPAGTSHYSDPKLTECWAKLLGAQNVIKLDNPDAVCETIGLTIGVMEGTANPDALTSELTDAGVSVAVASTVASALDPLAKTALVRGAVATGDALTPAAKGRSVTNERL